MRSFFLWSLLVLVIPSCAARQGAPPTVATPSSAVQAPSRVRVEFRAESDSFSTARDQYEALSGQRARGSSRSWSA